MLVVGRRLSYFGGEASTSDGETTEDGTMQTKPKALAVARATVVMQISRDTAGDRFADLASDYEAIRLRRTSLNSAVEASEPPRRSSTATDERELSSQCSRSSRSCTVGSCPADVLARA